MKTFKQFLIESFKRYTPDSSSTSDYNDIYKYKRFHQTLGEAGHEVLKILDHSGYFYNKSEWKKQFLELDLVTPFNSLQSKTSIHMKLYNDIKKTKVIKEVSFDSRIEGMGTKKRRKNNEKFELILSDPSILSKRRIFY